MPFYDFNYGVSGGEELAGAALVIYLISMFFSLAISVAAYVMQSVGLYSIADRRGIKKPWLAWVPVGNMWIMGCISDQYRYVAKGQVKNKRKSLLILNILMWVLMVAFFAVFAVIMVKALSMDPNGFVSDEQAFGLVGGLLGMLAVYLVMMGIAIAVTVIQYMALYDLYVSCEPGNGVLYLLLSIFVSWLMPILLLIIRKKDGGMPPRKQETVACIPQEPACEPAAPAEEPWQEPAAQEEPWQEPAPEQEPWQNPEE